MELTDDDFKETPEPSEFVDYGYDKSDDDSEVIEEDSYITDNEAIPFNKMIEGLSNEDYHSFGGLSSTKFPLMDLSIRVFENRHLLDTDKPVYDVGNLCHDCILLPDLVENGYIESPTVGLDTLQADKVRDENPNKMIVGQGDIEKYQNIAKLVRVIIHFINFETTKKEVSFFHKHEETGLIFQVRPDIYNPNIGLLYDVKSTKANSHKEFNKVIEEYDYDLSIAFYYDVLVMCGAKIETVKKDRFDFRYIGWVCVPKSKPNAPFVFRCSYELLEKGREKYQRLLTKYIDYKKAESEVGKDDNDLIYSDIAEKVAYSYEYRRENFI